MGIREFFGFKKDPDPESKEEIIDPFIADNKRRLKKLKELSERGALSNKKPEQESKPEEPKKNTEESNAKNLADTRKNLGLDSSELPEVPGLDINEEDRQDVKKHLDEINLDEYPDTGLDESLIQQVKDAEKKSGNNIDLIAKINPGSQS